ncbi:MAG TPA: DUF427 domain-containing protein [Caulobacteraceae bacterium]|nr:DUF427 domain-containing protein [Caulobacteraceae bacterium]
MAEMRLPGPDHPITLAAKPTRMRARFHDTVIAETADAIELCEAGYKPVIYFPRSDVDIGYFGKTARVTHCPYKGEASYYTITLDAEIAENAAWSYEDPYPAMADITGRIAFYPHYVEVYEVPEAHATDPDEVVLHTDEGDGASQRPTWPATATNPDIP